MTHYSGRYASVTTGGHVVYESRLELDRPLLAVLILRCGGPSLSRVGWRLGSVTGFGTMFRAFLTGLSVGAAGSLP